MGDANVPDTPGVIGKLDQNFKGEVLKKDGADVSPRRRFRLPPERPLSTRRSRGKTHMDEAATATRHALCAWWRSTCPKSHW